MENPNLSSFKKRRKIKQQRKSGTPKKNLNFQKKKIPTAGNFKYRIRKNVYYLDYTVKVKFSMSTHKSHTWGVGV